MTASNKLNYLSVCPHLKGEVPNPLTGPHLDWMSRVSKSLQGSNGSGDIRISTNDIVGKYKAIGGVCSCTISLPTAGTYTIVMPSDPTNVAPVHFSDGQIQWGSVDSDKIWTIQVTTTSSVTAYCSYLT